MTEPSSAGTAVASYSDPLRSRIRSRVALPMGMLLFGLGGSLNAPRESVTVSTSPKTRPFSPTQVTVAPATGPPAASVIRPPTQPALCSCARVSHLIPVESPADNHW